VPRLPSPRIVISRTATTLFAALLLVLGTAAAASAGSTHKILETCSNGNIPTGYSQHAYDQALKQMPPELSEYSDCSDLIHKAQLSAAAGRGGGTGAGGAGPGAGTVAPPTAAEQHTLEHVAHSGGAPVRVGGEVIHPGVVHVDIASAVANLPTPLLALLAFLLACALLLLGRTLHARIRDRRREA
jgi:hypothetical protein